MKTLPFNLKLALAGHALVTRGGEKVTGFSKHPTESRDPIKCHAFIGEKEIYEGFTRKGTKYCNDCESDYDLFLLIEE